MERRRGLDVVIVALVAIMLIDGLPNFIPGIPTLSRWLDPVVDVTGLEQTSWKLFAPDPDHINTYVEALITYEDGSVAVFTTPAWRGRTLWQKLVDARWHKAADNLRMDSWRGAWAPFADYAVREAVPPSPGLRPVHVSLTRHWWLVPPPRRFHLARERFGELPPARADFPGHKQIFERDLLKRRR